MLFNDIRFRLIETVNLKMNEIRVVLPALSE